MLFVLIMISTYEVIPFVGRGSCHINDWSLFTPIIAQLKMHTVYPNCQWLYFQPVHFLTTMTYKKQKKNTT